MDYNNIDTRYLSDQPEGKNRKYPTPVISGIFFSLTTILLTYGGPLIAFKNSYLKSGMGELLFVLFPAIAFLIVGRYNIKDTLKLRKTKPVNYLIVVFLMLFGMPVVGVLNAIVLGIIRLVFGKILPIPQIPIPDVPTLFIAILVIGASAAICEEILFRGLISKGLEKYGVVTSLVVTSILFGILHRDIQKAVSTILLGVLIGFIVYRTKSIYAGMTAHFTNNTVAVLLTFVSSKMSQKLDGVGLEKAQNFDFSGIPTVSLVIVIIFYALLFMGFISAFIALLYAFNKNTQKDMNTGNQEHQEIAAGYGRGSNFKLSGILSMLPGLILIFLTFVSQILKLMDMNSGIIYNAIRAVGLI